MSTPETASNMTLTLPGNITSSDVFSFSISSSGGETIDVTPVTQNGGARTYIGTPMGSTMEASVSYFGSGSGSIIGEAGNITIGDTTFYGVCTASTATAGVNDVARFDATFKQVTAPSS
jgi:hypothetical protein